MGHLCGGDCLERGGGRLSMDAAEKPAGVDEVSASRRHDGLGDETGSGIRAVQVMLRFGPEEPVVGVVVRYISHRTKAFAHVPRLLNRRAQSAQHGPKQSPRRSAPGR